MVFDNDSEQVLRLHLKVMEIGREGWVVVPQLAVGAHDLCSPLQKQRIPAYYSVHHKSFWKNCCLQFHRSWTPILLSLLSMKYFQGSSNFSQVLLKHSLEHVFGFLWFRNLSGIIASKEWSFCQLVEFKMNEVWFGSKLSPAGGILWKNTHLCSRWSIYAILELMFTDLCCKCNGN